MINSLIGSIMNMKCDVYIQQNTQTSSGAIQRSWVFHNTIDCRIEPIKAGKSVNASDNKTFNTSGDKSYEESLELKLKSAIPLSKRYRITRVRTNDDVTAYKELDRYNTPDMIFEVMTSHAEIDPLGKIHYYQSTIKRVPVQENDTNFS